MMNRLPGYLFIICAVLFLLSALFFIFSFVMIIRYHVTQYNLAFLVRLGAIIAFQLVTSYLAYRYGKRLLRRSKL